MAAVVLTGPACPGCAGGGEVNGVPCPECRGSRLAKPQGRRWSFRSSVHRLADALAVPAGSVVGTAMGWSSLLPGVGGAAAVSWGAADVVHSLAPSVPMLGATVLVAGIFGLVMDRRLLWPTTR